MAKSSVQYVCSNAVGTGRSGTAVAPSVVSGAGGGDSTRLGRRQALARLLRPNITHAFGYGSNNAKSAARPITEVGTESVERLGTGFSEFDRVLGGGVVPGS